MDNEQRQEGEAGAPQTTQPAAAPSGVGEAAAQAQATLGRLENIQGWSWGGFMLGPGYMIATKNYVYLLLYLLTLVPLVNVFAWLGISIFLGLQGHQMVAKSAMFKNDDERNGFNRAVDHAGFIMFLIMVALFVLGFLFFGMMMSMFVGSMGGMEYGSGPGDSPF